METLKNYVDWKLAHSDKVANAEGYPLVMENCKANKRMKQLQVYGDCMQSQTPSPDNPSEIQSVGDLTTKNLFDSNAEMYNLRVSTSEILSVNNYKTIFVNVENIQNFVASFYNSTGNIYFALCDEIIAGATTYNAKSINVSTQQYIVTDNTHKYLGISIYYTNIVLFNKCQVEEGSTATKYEPYHKYKIPITLRGKNLFDISKIISNSSVINNGDGTITAKVGGATAATPNTLKDYCPMLKVGDTAILNYNISAEIEDVSYASKIYLYGANISWVNGKSKVITQAILDSKVAWYPARDSEGNNYPTILSNIQIEKGATVTEYESYVEPITQNIYLDEPLRKVGDYADYIDFKNQKVIRSVKEKIFDGTESFNGKYIDSSNAITYPLPHLADSIAILTRSEWGNGATKWANNTNLLFSVLYYDVTTVDELKTKFAEWYTNGEPLKMHYILGTSTEEDISCQLPKTLAKTTIIEVDTTLLPSNIKGKYVIK